ncbi:a1ae2214-67ea-4537-9cfd-911cd8c1bc04 [Sclerotinia trifoliorum]|uniref:A1ae2214-67ea-4537-9cfd-911cd8c1bc04 n=1 Tax=Sclerotinia trifoliorum TaxID=28548 RepID=A0A8H2VVI5_9HELO|nr:a1ae2214-67ea-4537-9cfd-911cd8c1bc04 [Sclerotinia trifoliorum]
MAGQYDDLSSSLPVDFTSYPSPATSQYLNYQSQSGTQGYNMQYAEGESATSCSGYGQTANVYQQNGQRGNLYRNGGYSPDTPYSQGTAFPPPHGIGQTILPFHPQYNHGSFMGNVPYYQCPANFPPNVSGQVVNPIYHSAFMPQENNNHPRCQFSPTQQGYVRYYNPLYAFSATPQSGASFNNAASPIVNSTASASANSTRNEYKTPPHLVTPSGSHSHRGYLMTPSNQYLSGGQVNNGVDQMLASTPVPRTPQSTPAGLLDRIQNTTPDDNYIAIKRKPAMRSKNDPINAEDVMHGSIVWLSNHQDWHEPIICVQNHECNDKIKEIDGHNHPVTILRINQRHGSDIIGDIVLDIAIMTTLCGLSLQGYVRRLRALGPDTSKQWYLQETMPLSWIPQQTSDLKGSKLEEVREHEKRLESKHHAELNERGNTLLSLSRGTMQRRTYMRVHHIYAVPIKQLQACSRYAKLAHMVRLDEPSYRRVMESLNLVPDSWETSVEKSVASAPQRLRDLRDAGMARLNAVRVTDRLCLQQEAAEQQSLAISQQKSPTDVAAGDVKGYEDL